MLVLSLLSDTRFAGNELWRIVLFFAIILLSLIAGRVAQAVMSKAEPNGTGSKRKLFNILLRALSRPAVLASFTIGFSMAVSMLILGDAIASATATVSRILTVITAGYALYSLVDVLDFYLSSLSGNTHSKIDDMLFPLIGRSVRITIAVFASLQAIQALSDRPVTSIIAGLGVGGLAIALAGQDTVKNFFGSLVVICDKPFEIGDRIIIDGFDGPVESMGFRSTRIRTLEGHLVTIPNGELVNKTIQNIGRRHYIRRVSNITITYDTPMEKVDRAIEIIKEILNDHEGMNPEFPPKVFFNDFNDSSLNIMMIYWYFPPDYWKYMAFTERVNRELLSRFNSAGIDFAFPSQTIYLPGQEKR